MNRRFVRSLLLAALLVLLCTQVFAAQETLAALRLDPESGFTRPRFPSTIRGKFS